MRIPLLLGLIGTWLAGSLVVSAQSPQIYQDFTPWSGLTSPDGIWRINGPWVGTGGNTMEPSLTAFSTNYSGETDKGFLSLSVAANELDGSEIQTLTTPGYSYGYYETRMKVTSVPGVVVSFFWIEAPSYGPHEWDIEFLTDESWITSTNSGAVHLTIHPSNATYILNLPFNPSLAFHRYGFLWTAGQISFTVDGQVAYTFTDSTLNTTAQGFIMMNTWTGAPDWGGGPPTQQATSVYDYVAFYPNAAAIPGPYSFWQANWFGANASTTLTGDTVVNNQAGVANLVAYALDLDPYTALPANAPQSGTAAGTGGEVLTLNFNRNTSATELTYTVQGTNDLANWSTVAAYSGGTWSPSANVTETGSGNPISVQVKDTQLMSAAPKRFLRLQISH